MSNYPSTKLKSKKAWARPTISKVDLQVNKVSNDTDELDIGKSRSQCIEALRHTLEQTEKNFLLNRCEDSVRLRQILQRMLEYLECQQSSSGSSNRKITSIQTTKTNVTSPGGDQ